MSEDDADEDLAAVAGELANSIKELRRDLDERQPRSGPAGLPRPPSPREFFRFADEVAIPATIAILEANIKLLEALQRAIRLADREREVRERTTEARARAGELSAETVDRFDDALSELQRVIEDGPLPNNETARDVLSEARSLRDQLDERVHDATARGDDSRETGSTTEIDIAPDEDETDEKEQGDRRAPGADQSAEDESAVDVDSELEYLKDKYSDDTTGDDGDTTRDDGEASEDDEAARDGEDDSDAVGSS
jgi:hypothetical protein